MLFARKPEGVDVHEAARRIERGEAFVLDVREPDEWEGGRIPEATHIPLGEIAARLDELPHDRAIIAVCRSGNRSGHVTAALQRAGYRIENLEGGLKAWHEAGLPLEPADGRVA